MIVDNNSQFEDDDQLQRISLFDGINRNHIISSASMSPDIARLKTYPEPG